MCAQWVLHKVEVHQYPEGEAAASSSRQTIVEFCLTTWQGKPSYIPDVGWVVSPHPKTGRPSVLAFQRWLLNVVEVLGSCNSPLGNALILGLQGDALQT